MDPKFEAEQLRVFATLVEKGYVYNSLKPVYWCVTTRTALAEAEIVYKEKESNSIYFLMKSSKELETKLDASNLYLAVWTTTPWTLPANLAVALNPDLDYVVTEEKGKNIIVAKELYETLKEKLSLGKILREFKGHEIENYSYEHPFIKREGKIVLGHHVTPESGTGCVHTAPGHGMDDYILGTKYGLEILCPVDEKGVMTKEADNFEGLFYEDANMKIIEALGSNLLLHEKIKHSYPYSERGKKPIIFRATKQWFIDVNSGLREKCLKEIENVSFLPSEGEHRLRSMMENRPDWCISRQRVWGVPIPVFFCNKCNKPLLDSKLIREIAEEVKINGSNIFVSKDAEYFLKSRYKCCEDSDFRKGEDIFDVWFDSGTTYSTVLKDNIADLYLEGSDQHRGWFQTSLLTSVGSREKAPYKSLVTHGFVMDGNGIKMSKSLGNVVLPQDIVSKYGADILRLWTASVDFMGDVRISEDILKQNIESYRKIRNAFRFILGNIHDLSEDSDAQLMKIDELAITKLDDTINKATNLFDRYQFHNGMLEIVSFLTEMSSFYFDIVKDRLYTSLPKSKERISCQIVLKKICQQISKFISPVLSFTSEEVWSYLSDNSVFLSEIESLNPKLNLDIWEKVLLLRSKVNTEIEKLIENDIVKKSSQVSVDLFTNLNFFNEDELKEIFKVAEVNITMADENKVVVNKFNGIKCDRCWLYFNYIKEGEVCEKCRKVLEDI